MKRISLALAALLLLPACQSVKQQLGVGRGGPDEFAVVKRAPLSLPPDFELRPPGEGATPAGADPSAAAKAAVLGGGTDAGRQSGEEALLATMGAQNADPNIRAVIDHENGVIAVQNTSVKDKLLFWKDAPAADDPAALDKNAPPSEVDAKAEAERLKKNKTEGKPVNDGEVPTIKRKQNTIEKLLD
jgi:Protein of unknown function (DUF3035)